MDAFALLGHPAFVAAIFVAVVAVALVLIRRRRRRAAAPAPAPPQTQTQAQAQTPTTEAAYLDSSHILDGPIVGEGARPDPPRDR